jgi:hypothetical protein
LEAHVDVQKTFAWVFTIKETGMWQSGDTVILRGMYNRRPSYVQSAIVVKDTPEEVALLVAPGAECAAPSGYIHKKHGDHTGWKRWDDMLSNAWQMETYAWHTNRFLILLEPLKFYSAIYIWEHASGIFQCYYINFQLPFERTPLGFDTFDLELDLVIAPDCRWEWKDVAEYQTGIEKGVLRPEWVQGIKHAKQDVFARLEQRLYPLNGEWLHWQPDPQWVTPRLPDGWDF